MKQETGGKIINIASMLSFQGGIRVPAYTASKSGVMGLTKALANEWAKYNINVNAIAPGFIATDMTDVLSDEIKETIQNQIPLKRMGNAKEVAELAYFLGSEQSSYITGQVIHVDGGMVM